MDYTISHPSSSPLRNLSIVSFADRVLGEVYIASSAAKSSGKAAVGNRGVELVLFANTQLYPKEGEIELLTKFQFQHPSPAKPQDHPHPLA